MLAVNDVLAVDDVPNLGLLVRLAPSSRCVRLVAGASLDALGSV